MSGGMRYCPTRTRTPGARAVGFRLTARHDRDARPPCQRPVASRPALDFPSKNVEACPSRSDVGDMTTKHPSRLAASGPADDPDSEQITKEHSDDDGVDDITVDPSSDVTVEASEDVMIEAASRTPHPTLASGGAAT